MTLVVLAIFSASPVLDETISNKYRRAAIIFIEILYSIELVDVAIELKLKLEKNTSAI